MPSNKNEHPLVKGYTCSGCGAHGVKLWREYNTFLENQTLTCFACTPAPRDGMKKVASSAIGWRVAAVPTEDNSSFWGYTSVPDEAVAWWQALPTEMAPKEPASNVEH